jgi:hypothetical protein
MAICECEGCAEEATHTVDLSFPEGTHESWQVCRAHDRELKNRVRYSRPKAPPPPADTPPRIEVCCGECKQALNESTSLPEEERQPCPNCGSLTRMHKITIVETVAIHEGLRLRSKQPGKGGWMRDFQTGDDYSRYLEGWGTRSLDMDREQNVYREVVVHYDGTSIESRAKLTGHHD